MKDSNDRSNLWVIPEKRHERTARNLGQSEEINLLEEIDPEDREFVLEI